MTLMFGVKPGKIPWNLANAPFGIPCRHPDHVDIRPGLFVDITQSNRSILAGKPPEGQILP